MQFVQTERDFETAGTVMESPSQAAAILKKATIEMQLQPAFLSVSAFANFPRSTGMEVQMVQFVFLALFCPQLYIFSYRIWGQCLP